jgi:glycosyltransferase involved in cell wall biosynthesis
MSQHPYFTIAIPTYNRAAFLRQAINSALSQTDSDFELIISDNASTDDTPAVVASIKDERLRYVRQPANLGAIKNVNFLVREARGRFFVLHQDDDLLHPEFLRRCQQAVGNRSDVSLFAAAVYSGAEPAGIMGENISLRPSPLAPVSHVDGKITEISGVDVAIMNLFSYPLMPPGLAFCTEALRKTGALFSEFLWAGDNITVARVALCGSVLFDPQVGAFVRFHSSNFSGQISLPKALACRREANRIIINYLDAAAPGWVARARVCLNYLPRRRRWKYLAEAWKTNYPPVLKQVLAESVVGKSSVRKLGAHLFAIFLKGKFFCVLSSHFRPIKPSD